MTIYMIDYPAEVRAADLVNSKPEQQDDPIIYAKESIERLFYFSTKKMDAIRQAAQPTYFSEHGAAFL